MKDGFSACDKADANAIPPSCDITTMREVSGKFKAASRHTTLELLAGVFPAMGGVDRPGG